LNQYVSFSSTPAGSSAEPEPSLDEVLPGSAVHDPVNQVISSEELQALVACISTALSELESRVLSLYLDGHSYEEIGRRLSCDCKTVDNALQRVKRKVGQHLASRAVPV
jgi:RNA polymerase sporulation-specific sigma factor